MTDRESDIPGPDPTDGLVAEVAPPADLRAQVVGRLHAEGLLPGLAGPGRSPGAGGAGATLARWALTAAAVVVGFLGGRATASPAAVDGVGGAPAPAGARWALFLYEDGPMAIGDRSLDEVEGEYVAWARQAAEAGTLVLGEKLAEVEFVLDSEAPPLERPLGVGDPPGILTGMFVVEAPSLEAAVEAARSTPHRAFGGTVLIRPIDPT